MYGKKYSKVLTVILIVIIVAVVGLLGFLGYNYYKNHSTINGASDYVDNFDSTISTETPVSSTDTTNATDIGDALVGDNSTSSSSSSTKKTTYQGFEVLGTIEIPATDCKYPILAKLSAKALDTAVVAIYPSSATLNSVGNVVIAGHNYRNGTFFSNNKKLTNGDKIYIKDLDGNKVTYIIYDMFETTDTDTTFYNRDTDGAREITLTTCTDDATARLIILAKEEE